MSVPAIWMIGDLQGCCASLDALLAHSEIAADPDAQFWFAGDLVNRGPQSLQTLRRIIALGDRAATVLGNHDLHLLAVSAGIRKPSRSDTFADILAAPDAADLLDWLRHRPLALHAHGHLMVHAGVLPQWSVHDVMERAAEVQRALRSKDWKSRLANMYGNEPVRWRDDLGRNKRLRVIVNALTRLRMCDRKGRMEFAHKGAPSANGGELMPWFDVPDRRTRDQAVVVFGHWSTLGLMMRPDVICLDSGCVWGGQLSALRLHDRALVQIPCVSHQAPGQSKAGD